MAKLWARPVHGVLILATGGGGGGGGPLGPMLDPPLTRAWEGGVRRPAGDHVSLEETIPLVYHSASYVTLSEKKDCLFYVLQFILHAVTRQRTCHA